MKMERYNRRLFSGGPRTWVHQARFRWLHDKLARLGCDYTSLLELGCFDGKLLDELPERPVRYLGLDANHGGGIDLARQRWAGQPGWEFRVCATAQEMRLDGEQFDIAVCMETLEHVPPDGVGPYLAELARATRCYLFLTAPNEKGLVFFVKYLAKTALWGNREMEPYSFAEFVDQSLGRTERVARGEHKGFDYDWLIRQVEQHFEVLSVSGIPLGGLPRSLNLQVGVVARPAARRPGGRP